MSLLGGWLINEDARVYLNKTVTISIGETDRCSGEYKVTELLMARDGHVEKVCNGGLRFEFPGIRGIQGSSFGEELIEEFTAKFPDRAIRQEYGRMEIEIVRACGLIGSKEVDHEQTAWMSHGDEAAKLPEGFEVVIHSQWGTVAIVENRERRFCGFRYHPEVTHSP